MTIVFGLVPSKSKFPQSLSPQPKIFFAWLFFFFLKKPYTSIVFGPIIALLNAK